MINYKKLDKTEINILLNALEVAYTDLKENERQHPQLKEIYTEAQNDVIKILTPLKAEASARGFVL